MFDGMLPLAVMEGVGSGHLVKTGVAELRERHVEIFLFVVAVVGWAWVLYQDRKGISVRLHLRD
jgi:hypothetical protein